MSSTNFSHKWGVCGSAKGVDLKLFHEQVNNEGAIGRTHGCTMYLFIILTLEEEISVLGQNSSNLIICWIDMLVLWGSVGSCDSFCCTICMEGSTGTDVNRAFTSKDVLTFPVSSLTCVICSTKCCVFLRW